MTWWRRIVTGTDHVPSLGAQIERAMTIRTTRQTIRFNSPFSLTPIDGMLPPGDYEVETDEEEIETVSRTAYLRVATLLTVNQGGMSRTYTINPAELDAALIRDGQRALPR